MILHSHFNIPTNSDTQS